ncbi:hypothetical protein N7466_002148 [Penicillium verhagenii]|uniref:uncharacterized protein n=1 Tax=Penicillium verhagenii TaxID=1562060 RepID=UPI002544D431|nr:uncharacterized protein N7466_002148 [Penicillium verhagenii]KAJ5939014.1 hypothetical protein N7466_002148 [Penicillium verhagenii]
MKLTKSNIHLSNEKSQHTGISTIKSYLVITGLAVIISAPHSSGNPKANFANITTASVNVQTTTISIADFVGNFVANLGVSVGNLVVNRIGGPNPASQGTVGVIRGERSDESTANKGKKSEAHLCKGLGLT